MCPMKQVPKTNEPTAFSMSGPSSHKSASHMLTWYFSLHRGAGKIRKCCSCFRYKKTGLQTDVWAREAHDKRLALDYSQPTFKPKLFPFRPSSYLIFFKPLHEDPVPQIQFPAELYNDVCSGTLVPVHIIILFCSHTVFRLDVTHT